MGEAVLAGLEQQLESAVRPGGDQAARLVRLLDTVEGQLGPLLATAAQAGLQQSRAAVLARSLAAVPDRTAGQLGLEDSALPGGLQAGPWCRSLLAGVAASLTALQSQPSCSLVLQAALLQALDTRLQSDLLQCEVWWAGLAARPAPGLLALLRAPARERALLVLLARPATPEALLTLFGDSVGEEEALRLLAVRGTGLGAGAVQRLLRYLALARPGSPATMLDSLLAIWGDPVEVDRAGWPHLLCLARALCCSLGCLDKVDQAAAAPSATRRLLAGMPHWLEARPDRRALGQTVASLLLEGLGGTAPAWELQQTELSKELELLCRDHTVKDTELQSAAPEAAAAPAVLTVPASASGLDSDDEVDSDDDLPAYDMSSDTVQQQDSKPVLYARDAIEQLVAQEGGQQWESLAAVPRLCNTTLQHEDPAVLTELLQLVLQAQNLQERPDWAGAREAALLAVTRCAPLPAAACLVRAVFCREISLESKLAALDCLVGAGAGLREAGRPDLGRYLASAVGGLCGGGGGVWGGARVAGLDCSVLTHTLYSLAGLLRLGEHSPGWQAQLSDCVDLLLAVGGPGAGQAVQTAVLHCLGVAAALVPVQLLDQGRLGGQLGRAAHWAATRTGELAQSGSSTAELLHYKHQQSLKLQMERELSEATQLKMTVADREVRIK